MDKLVNGKLQSQLAIAKDGSTTQLGQVLEASPLLCSVARRRQTLTGLELSLYRKTAAALDEATPHIHLMQIDISGGFDSWIEPLKTKLKQLVDEGNDRSRLWIISRCPNSGILGFANCLRLEAPYGSRVRFVFAAQPDSNNNSTTTNDNDTDDQITKIDFSSPFMRELICKDLALNVCVNGQWGSYRFVRLADQQQILPTTQAYLSQTIRGDLSSLDWFESEHNCFADLNKLDDEKALCDVYYSALNFKVSNRFSLRDDIGALHYKLSLL